MVGGMDVQHHDDNDNDNDGVVMMIHECDDEAAMSCDPTLMVNVGENELRSGNGDGDDDDVVESNGGR